MPSDRETHSRRTQLAGNITSGKKVCLGKVNPLNQGAAVREREWAGRESGSIPPVSRGGLKRPTLWRMRI